MPLVPCTSCSRHVRTNESICPFCASRRAIAIVITAALVGCGGAPASSSETSPVRGENQQGRVDADEAPREESLPPEDTTVRPDPANEDPGSAPVAAYGGPPLPDSPRAPSPRR